MIRHIIWDFDGTLFDTYPAIVYSFKTVLQSDFGVQYSPEEIERLVMVDARHCVLDAGQKYGLDPDAVLSKVRDFYNSQTDVAELPYDGSREVCESIAQRGGINALVTHRERSSTIAMLERFRMLGLFSIILTADDGFAPKPAPDSFCYVVNSASLDQSETLAVGDRDLDIEAAIAAGIRCAFFNPEGKVHPKADVSIQTLREIKKLEQVNNHLFQRPK
jgi:phosphoglycolate phosphatase-like HAD superfamily hydrolase